MWEEERGKRKLLDTRRDKGQGREIPTAAQDGAGCKVRLRQFAVGHGRGKIRGTCPRSELIKVLAVMTRVC